VSGKTRSTSLSYDFDVILLDLNRPDLSDYEVLRRLRLAKVKTPVLILSVSVVATSKGQAHEFHQAA